MLDSMVERTCVTKNRETQSRTVVVFGNALINSGKHGTERICFRALKDLLWQRCCFVEIDEFQSSQYCSGCHAKNAPSSRASQALESTPLYEQWM